MNDEQYNEFIKRQLEKSEPDYYSDIEHDKNKVWNRIDSQLSKNKVIPFWFYSVAATILLLFGMGILFKLKLDSKNEEISRLKILLEKGQAPEESRQIAHAVELKKDTVTIYNKEIVNRTTQKIDTLVIRDTIINVVTKKDTVYMALDKPEIIKDSKLIADEKVPVDHTGEIIPVKTKKNRIKRIIFLFGKPKVTTPNLETQKLISLQAK